MSNDRSKKDIRISGLNETVKRQLTGNPVTVTLSSTTARSSQLDPGDYYIKPSVDCYVRQGGGTITAGNAAGTPSYPLAAMDEIIIHVDKSEELTEVCAKLNEAKAIINTHIASTTYHAVADATNTVTAADATTYATAYTLANQIKAKYNTHRSQATVHTNNDAGNAISSADATTHATLITLTNEIDTDVTAHQAAATVLAECITLANELRTDYAAHRVLTAGSVHGAADSTNATTAAACTDLATLLTLINDIKAKYNLHRVLTDGSVHGAADSTNVVEAAAATTLATAVTLVNELLTDYEAHRVLTSGSVHGGADATNTISAVAAATAGIHLNQDTDTIDSPNVGTAGTDYLAAITDGAAGTLFIKTVEAV